MKDNEILKTILTTEKILILYFMHDACTPCKQFKPIVNKVVDSLSEYVELIVVDSTESSLVQRYGVRSVPTTVILKDAEEVRKLTSTVSESSLRTTLMELL